MEREDKVWSIERVLACTCASEDRGGTMIYNSRLGESDGDDV